jgi:hypothetical protein
MHTIDEPTFFISPEGNDGWTGRAAEPSPEGTDGPFASINGCLLVLNEMRRRGQLNGRPLVMMRGGTYPRTHPSRIDPVTFAAAPGERPIIDGGWRVPGWAVGAFNGVTCWVADIGELVHDLGVPNSLFVNGNRARRPRWPREGSFRITALPTRSDGAVRRGSKRFVIDSDPAAIADSARVQMVLSHRWIDERLDVSHVDPQSRCITTRRHTVMRVEAGTAFHFENAPCGFGLPGDWYCTSEGILYYIPLPGETIGACDAVIPLTRQLLCVHGDPASGERVVGLTFEGITFRHTDWELPESWTHYWDPHSASHAWPPRDSCRHFIKCNGVDPQADHQGAAQGAYSVPGAISIRGASDITFRDCTIEHTGFYAIDVQDGSRRIVIDRCTMQDLGAGGVKVDGGDAESPLDRRTGHCHVTRCSIHAYGRVFLAGMGVIVMFADNNQIVGNHIYDGFQTGISLGWRWDYEPQVTRDTLIADNHIHHIGQGRSSDMGGIYTLGILSGTVIRGNRIHDMRASHYGACGIYLDQASSHILVEGNRVWNVGEAVSVHWGRSNTVRNNLFAYPDRFGVFLGRDPHNRWLDEPRLGVRFERNVFLLRGNVPAYADFERAIEDGSLVSDLNVYWNPDGAPIVCRFSPWKGTIGAEWGYAAGDAGSREFDLSAFRQFGWDAFSIVTDPHIEDPAHWTPNDSPIEVRQRTQAAPFVPQAGRR